MKRSFIRIIICAAIAVAFAGCHEDVVIDNENSSLSDNQTTSGAGGALAEGYFRAVFFPQQGSTLTRAEDGTEVRQPKGDELRGYSKAIQTLKCFVYQEQNNGEYLLIAEKDVIEYNQSTQNNVLWPLATEVSFDLPNGNYKAVFVGNASDKLFPPLKNKILTGVDEGDKFEDARLNMPETENGLAIFEDVDEGGKDIHNMLYLCTVDFNQDNFNGNKKPPYVLMQRVVSQHLYGRDLIETNDLAPKLVDALVDRIKQGDFLQTTLRELLENQLLSAVRDIVDTLIAGIFKVVDPIPAILDPILGGLFNQTPVADLVDKLREGLTDSIVETLVEDIVAQILDSLLQQLTADLLESLNDELLHPLLEAVVSNTLMANGGSILGLDFLLNPWAHINAVDIQYNSLTKSIGFDREVKAYYTKTDKDRGAVFSSIPRTSGIIEWDEKRRDEEVNYVKVTTLCGKEQEGQQQHLLSEINVNKESIDNDILGLVSSLVDNIEATLLNGLLVSIHKPLDYSMESNLRYSTRCELLNIQLGDEISKEENQKITLDINLGDILDKDAAQSLVVSLINLDFLKPVTGTLAGLINVLVTGIKALLTIPSLLIPGVREIINDLENVAKVADNLLDGLIGSSEDSEGGIVGRLVKALTETPGLDIYLPALNINNIRIDGQWDDTKVSNGAVIPADNRRP